MSGLKQCKKNKTFRCITIDEGHLYADHGTSFRSDIRQLKDDLFQWAYNDSGEFPSPHLIVMTATLT